ncbi:thioredoxin domain-containing protein [Sneathiella chinensis]|uniref:Thioredoxin domain-containing protein n=1 Tax=Sneathiella chinensis TaxID=349750 RepID=A0ABQ5U0V8_9PROT|nr:thioredoxin domain-containing protein [Sneathiella chinensis]GLQ04944.1 thioredoxin domain-containing protein [Sneathiella chinensis]
MKNVLHKETSPYLLQHKDNPVHWQPWSQETLDLAKREGKPILLSVGYAACHWCHVMAHESFEDDEVAALMNDLFINIKVDREERPDIDQIYQTSLSLLGEQGGWPLTMFLNSKGEPFWGGTYFPKQSGYGRPGFTDVLTAVSGIFKNEPEKVSKNRDALKAALKKMNSTPEGDRPKLTLEVLDRIADRYAQEADPEFGGIGSAPKFPQTYVLENIWRSYIRTGNEQLAEVVTKALIAMSQGGIYDHLGGGYARYSTDAAWMVPHFEKMLYDNAQILDLMLLVHAENKSDLLQARIYQTIGWLLREMTTDTGAFAATLDADSEGVEGKFYTWTQQQVNDILGDEGHQYSEIYGVREDGNWEDVNILHRLAYPNMLDPETEERLAHLSGLLFAEREKRVRPGLDDKVLTDWNGLMIASLAKAGMYFSEPDWIEKAEGAFTAITSLSMTDEGRLYHSYRQGQARHTGMLDDYANMARAGLVLFEATGKNFYLQRVQDWITILNTHFWADEGGYFLTADDAEALIVRTRNAFDNAVPAGNGTLIEVLAKLHYLTGEREPFEKATDIVRTFSAELGRNFFPLATFLNNFETLIEATQVIIVGRRDEPETLDLLAALNDFSLPARIVNILEATDDLPFDHPAKGKTRKDDKATAYICKGPVCSNPANNSHDLRSLLEEKS